MAPADDDRRLRLRDLLPEAVYLPKDSDPTFTAVRTDAATVQPGDLYVHLDEFDSDDAETAVSRGAAAVVTERLLPAIDAPQVLVTDTLRAHRELAAAASRTLSEGPVLLAVGGDNGAEQVATLLAAVHAHAGQSVGLCTRRVEDDGEHCQPRRSTSHGASDEWLLRCRLGGVDTAIVEATTATRSTTPPLVACLVSLDCDQLDERGRVRWPSVQAHRQAVVEALGPLDAGVVLVVNADCPESVRFASSHMGRVVTFGESSAADIRVISVETHTGGQSFIVTAASVSACVAILTPGRAARREALAAIATSLTVGFDLRSAVRGVELAPRHGGALEPVVCGQGFPVYLDPAARPAAIADAAEGARQSDGRLLVSLRLAENPTIARRQLATASCVAERVFAYGTNERFEKLPANVTVVEDAVAAMAVAIGLADSGDAVLLAGAQDRDRPNAIKLLRRRLECEDRRAAA